MAEIEKLDDVLNRLYLRKYDWGWGPRPQDKAAKALRAAYEKVMAS